MALDHEIHRYAAICGVNLANRYEIDACVAQHHDSGAEDCWAENKAGESLKGLLILRIKVEAEMIAAGLAVPPLNPSGEFPALNIDQDAGS